MSVILPLLLAAAASPTVSCGAEYRAHYERIADLPKGAAKVLAPKMAEKGQPYQEGDVVVIPTPPIRRFISAERRGCVLYVLYEFGGFSGGITLTTLLGTGAVDGDTASWTLMQQKLAPPDSTM